MPKSKKKLVLFYGAPVPTGLLDFLKKSGTDLEASGYVRYGRRWYLGNEVTSSDAYHVRVSDGIIRSDLVNQTENLFVMLTEEEKDFFKAEGYHGPEPICIRV